MKNNYEKYATKRYVMYKPPTTWQLIKTDKVIKWQIVHLILLAVRAIVVVGLIVYVCVQIKTKGLKNILEPIWAALR